MGERSSLLHRIEQAMKTRGHIVEFRDIPELRAVFRGRSGPFELMGLDLLLTDILNSTEAQRALWMSVPPKPAKKPQVRRKYKTKRRLTRAEMITMRSNGISVLEIAKQANVKTSRIYQIINRGGNDGNVVPN